MGQLNRRQELFCLHYAKTGNASESYRQAGYATRSENATFVSACRMLKNPNVIARLAELADEMKSDKIADIKEIHEYLTSVIRGETTDDTVITEGLGTGVSEARVVKIRTANAVRVKAAVELAKMQGAYDNKLQVELTVPVIGGDDDLAD